MSTQRLPADDPLARPAYGQGHGGIVAPTEAGKVATHEWRLDQLRKLKLPNAGTLPHFQIDSGVAGAVAAGAKTNPGVVHRDAIAVRFHMRADTAPTGSATFELWTATSSAGAYALTLSRTIAASTTDYSEGIAVFIPRRVGRFQWRIPTPAGMGYVTFSLEFE